MLENDAARPKPARFTPPLLDSWDVTDLTEYLAELRAEIERVEGTVARKHSKRAAAEAFFKPRSL